MLSIPVLSAICLVTVLGQERTVENSCPQGLIDEGFGLYLQVANERCYLFIVNSQKEFEDANEECQRYDGYLVMPKEEYLNDYLADTLYNVYRDNDPVWIGLHDAADEDVFKWVDGTEMTWHNFADGQGEDNNAIFGFFEDCVTIYPDSGEWHDYQCEDDWIAWLTGSEPAKNYVCEYPAIPLADVTEAPADVTEAPAVVTEAPVDVTENPADVTEAPADITEAPADVTEATADVTECPGFDCPGLDCEMAGYAVDENGCQLCECFYG